MTTGYSILFDDGHCVIGDKTSDNVIAKVLMAKNKIFPLEVPMIERYVVVASCDNETRHMIERYVLFFLMGFPVSP